jgi:ComF family protein
MNNQLVSELLQYVFPNEKSANIEKLDMKIHVRNNHIYFMEHNEEIGSIIKYAKYTNHPNSFKEIGRRIGELLIAENTGCDMVIPVPIHDTDRRKRGYNQSYILALQIARYTGLECTDKGLRKISHTHKQAGMNVYQRKRNVAGVFKAYDDIVAGKNILLVDDIYTTGSTLEECEKELLSKGAVKVIFLTITFNRRKTDIGKKE